MDYLVLLITRVFRRVCHQFEGVQQGRAWQANLWNYKNTWWER